MKLELIIFAVLALGGLLNAHVMRQILQEFRAFSFVMIHNVNTYKAHYLLEKCLDVTLSTESVSPEKSQMPPESYDRYFKGRAEGIINDIFIQNGLNPKLFKIQHMINMELYRRFKTVTIRKEVI